MRARPILVAALAVVACMAPGVGPSAAQAPARPKTDSDLRHLLENYCSTQRGARFSYESDYAECVLPGDESGALRFGTKRRVVKTPEDLAGAEHTDRLTVHEVTATAGSEGEDAMGYWGATVAWLRHGRVFNATVHLNFPKPGEDSPETLRRLYERARDRALSLARALDTGLR